MTFKQKAAFKILVAEDNLLNQKLLGFMLNTWGYKYALASNGKQAIDILQRDNFDVVLMDIEMPELDGYEATKYAREKLKLDIPIIAISAHASEDEKRKSIVAGMTQYISKPIKGEELQSLLENYLSPGLIENPGKNH
jgi:CheY-like chemotaxis protein